MDYKTITKKTYDEHADRFEEFAEQFTDIVKKEVDIFVEHFSGKTILDLGSGPGMYAAYFKEKGFDVLCVDISKEMVDRCKKKGLKAKVMDIEAIDFPEDSFDGVWAYASLLHVPKEKIPSIIEKIVFITKSNGLLGLALQKGDGEGLLGDVRYSDSKRWFTFFTDEEVRALFAPYFEIVRVEEYNEWLNYVMRLKNKKEM